MSSPMNRYCSPMRLFDHLASGAWVVATDACDQVKSFQNLVSVCDTPESFVSAVQSALTRPRRTERIEGIAWNDRARDILRIIEGVNIA